MCRTIKYALLIALGVFNCLASVAFADRIVTRAKLSMVMNTRTENDPSFVVRAEGGSGPCNGSWIYFYPSGASNPEMQKRAYSLAMLALASELYVDIEAPVGSLGCADAYFINVYR